MLLAVSIACLGYMHAPQRHGNSVRPRLSRTPPACGIGSADDRRELRATTQHSDDRALLADTQQLPPRSIEMALTRLVLPCASYAALIWTTTSTAHLLKDHLDWFDAWNALAILLFSIGLQACAFVQGYRAEALDWQNTMKSSTGEADIVASAQLTTLAAEAAEALGVPPPKNVCEVSISKPFACAIDAVGTGESTVGASTGLRELLTEKELSAVFAHELGHLRHKDTQHMSVIKLSVLMLKAPFLQGRQVCSAYLKPEIPDRSAAIKPTLTNIANRALHSAQCVIALYLMAAGFHPYVLSFLVEFADKAVRRGFELDADRAAAEAFGADATICGLSKIHCSRDDAGSLYCPDAKDLVEELVFHATAELMFEKRKEALEHEYYGAKRSFTDGELKEANLDNPIEFAAREVAKIEAEMRTMRGVNAWRDFATQFVVLQSTHPTLEVRIAAIEKAVNDGRVLRTITAAPNDDEESTRDGDELNTRPEFAEFADLFSSGPPAAPAWPNAATTSMAAPNAELILARKLPTWAPSAAMISAAYALAAVLLA